MTQNQPFNVLVVDDDPLMFDLLDRVGRHEFSEAVFSYANSPQEAIHYLDQQATNLPHLVLLDINFNLERNGIEWLLDLHERYDRKVPIVIFSESGNAHHVQQAYHSGAVAYTQKPAQLQGWKDYLTVMKKFWYETARLPQCSTDS